MELVDFGHRTMDWTYHFKENKRFADNGLVLAPSSGDIKRITHLLASNGKLYDESTRFKVQCCTVEDTDVVFGQAVLSKHQFESLVPFESARVRLWNQMVCTSFLLSPSFTFLLPNSGKAVEFSSYVCTIFPFLSFTVL